MRVVTEAIERIEERGIRTTDDELHEFDLIVLATGFKAHQFMRPMEVIGRDRVTLEEAWARRPSAYKSVSIPGFPNLFLLNGPNGPVGNFSLIDIAELQWGYIAQLIDLLVKGECKEISPKQMALEAFDAERVAAAKTTIFGTGCKSWYLDAEGVPATWPWSFQRFVDVMKAPILADYEVA